MGPLQSDASGPAASPAMAAYFRRLEDEADRALAVARAARAKAPTIKPAAPAVD